ncbi:MAG: thiosulfate sulfurtransferase GlpE [Thermodesulfobacteriota bacterium]
MAQSITPKELKALLQGDRETVLLDVRRKSDCDAMPEMIVGAAHRDPEKVDEWMDEIPKEVPVVVYCVKGGSVSQATTEKLLRDNPDVRFLEGGIKGWIETGEPVE